MPMFECPGARSQSSDERRLKAFAWHGHAEDHGSGSGAGSLAENAHPLMREGAGLEGLAVDLSDNEAVRVRTNAQAQLLLGLPRAVRFSSAKRSLALVKPQLVARPNPLLYGGGLFLLALFAVVADKMSLT